MRPKRPATVLAEAAIAQISKLELDFDEDRAPVKRRRTVACDSFGPDDGYGEASEQPLVAAVQSSRSSSAPPSPPNTSDASESRAEPDSPHSEATSFVYSTTVPDSPISRLPSEILKMIVLYLDDMPIDIFSILLTSKYFYRLLTGPSDDDAHILGKKAFKTEQHRTEMEWKRRVALIKSSTTVIPKDLKGLRKSSGAETWRETFVSILRGRCLRCTEPTSAKFGMVWPAVPDQSVMCRCCQTGPFECVSAACVGLSDDELEEIGIEYKWARHDYKKGYYREYLQSTVAPIAHQKQERLRLQREAAAKQAAELARQKEAKQLAAVNVMVKLFRGDKECLRGILMQQEGGIQESQSWKFPKMVTKLKDNETPTQAAMKEVVDFWKKSAALRVSLHANLRAVGISNFEEYIKLSAPPTQSGRLTWLDLLVTGKKKESAFIELVEEMHQGKIDKLAQQEAARKRREELRAQREAAREHVDELPARHTASRRSPCACGNTPAVDCPFELCRTCCSRARKGTCRRHGTVA